MTALPPVSSYIDELKVAIDAARQAADVIMTFYSAQSANTYTKGDGSPVTDADLAADKILRETIAEAFPNDGFLTEESERTESSGNDARIWIIDPIDGTKEFIAQTGRFDVLIGFVKGDRPIMAVSIQPATGLMHAAVAGEGAFRHAGSGWEPFTLGDAQQPPRLVRSVWYRGEEAADTMARIADALCAPHPELLDVGFQPRAFDPKERMYDAFLGFPHEPGRSFANEWDLCASDLIVNEAGGRFTDVWGRLYPYNKRNTHISGGILVSADPALHDRLIDLIAPIYPDGPASLDPADDLERQG